jgi:hypothetical protein
MSKLEKEAWRLTSLYVRLSASENGYAQCVTCGETHDYRDMDAGHWINSHFKATKFKLENLCVQCKYENNNGGAKEAHEQHIRETYGQETIDELLSLKHENIKRYDCDYADIIAEMTELLKTVEGNK